jgi:hypothetical protein
MDTALAAHIARKRRESDLLARIDPKRMATVIPYFGSALYRGRTATDEEVAELSTEALEAVTRQLFHSFPTIEIRSEEAPPKVSASQKLDDANRVLARRADAKTKAKAAAQAQQEPPLTPAERARVATLDARNKLSFANDPEFRARFLNRKKD